MPENTPVYLSDGPSIDAFGRLRIAEPYTIFDSKQIADNAPLFWDDAETSGSGTGSTHSINTASSEITVGASTAGTRVRQTFQRFNYQPGKSQEILFTFANFDTENGITKRVGYFDENNGIFFQHLDGVPSVCIRSNTSGSPVDTIIPQSEWNIDKLDGTDYTNLALDFSKTQIGIIDFEWLGVGRVRIGMVIDGAVFYCHEFLHANQLTSLRSTCLLLIFQ